MINKIINSDAFKGSILMFFFLASLGTIGFADEYPDPWPAILGTASVIGFIGSIFWIGRKKSLK
jgi:hypothetical protein